MNNERRSSTRVAVDLWVEEQTEDAVYFQRATNVSLGGLFLHGTLPHAAGTRVVLRLWCPGRKESVRVRGEVVPTPTRERGMAVRFVDLTVEARRALRAVMRPSRARAARMKRAEATARTVGIAI